MMLVLRQVTEGNDTNVGAGSNAIYTANRVNNAPHRTNVSVIDQIAADTTFQSRARPID
jgi:uncharacterized repeat protein (TIGR01451 family)